MLRPHGTPTARSRRQVFLLWQLPTLLLCAVAVVGLTISGDADAWAVTLLLPAVLIAGATVATLLAPWADLPPQRRMLVPIVDVLAVLLLEVGAVDVVPSIALLAVLPLAWLGFEIAWAGVVAAGVGVVVVAAQAVLAGDSLPDDASEWLDVVLLPLVVVSLVVVTQFISDLLRRNQQLLRDQLTIEQGVLDSVDTAVWFYDADDILRMRNQPAIRAAAAGGFSLERPPHTGEQMWTEDRCALIPAEEQLVPRALREERVGTQLQWWGPPGNQVALVAGARRLRRPDGVVLGTVVATWDVSELVESLRVREEFLATVSHELRTPLTSIMGYLEIAQDDLPSGSSVLPTLAVIERNARTLLDRISHLLVANAGTVEEDIEPVRQAVGPVVSAVVERHRPTAAAAEVELRADVPAGITGRIDAARFDQVVDNLVSNAIKYTPPGGAVDVVLVNQDGGFDLYVSDTGVGMSDVERRHAFDRFYRTTGARKSAAQGFGVGLSIVRDIVRAHRGEVSLEVAPGGGTRAVVSIPHHETVEEEPFGRPRIRVV